MSYLIAFWTSRRDQKFTARLYFAIRFKVAEWAFQKCMGRLCSDRSEYPKSAFLGRFCKCQKCQKRQKRQQDHQAGTSWSWLYLLICLPEYDRPINCWKALILYNSLR